MNRLFCLIASILWLGKPGRITQRVKLEDQNQEERKFVLSKEFIDYKRWILNVLDNSC